MRELAIEHERRDILSALSPTDVLEAHERTLLLRSALDVGERLFSRLHELEKLWSVCEELMVENEAELRKVVEEARELARSSEQVNSLLDSLTRLNLHGLSQVFLRGNVGLVAP